jgi:hypothetical protein
MHLTFSGEAVTFSGEAVTFSGEAVTFSAEAVTLSGTDVTLSVGVVTLLSDEKGSGASSFRTRLSPFCSWMASSRSVMFSFSRRVIV